jgi:hypothetical protein
MVAALALLPRPVMAQGGPPLITDDPDTPGPGYWELNLFDFEARSHADHRSEIPRLDVNYGVGRRIQLKLEMPWLRVRPADGPRASGPGDAAAGVKWRFLGQEGQTLAWAVYPQIEFNTDHASVDKGLVEDGSRFLLPTEITLEVAHVEVNAEVGDEVARGSDVFFYGLSTEAGITHGLELLAEIHGERSSHEPGELLFNLGGRLKLTHQVTLMAAAGHAFRGDGEQRPRLLLLAGIQMNLPGTFSFAPPRPPPS